jgi:hypothetical protein
MEDGKLKMEERKKRLGGGRKGIEVGPRISRMDTDGKAQGGRRGTFDCCGGRGFA